MKINIHRRTGDSISIDMVQFINRLLIISWYGWIDCWYKSLTLAFADFDGASDLDYDSTVECASPLIAINGLCSKYAFFTFSLVYVAKLIVIVIIKFLSFYIVLMFILSLTPNDLSLTRRDLSLTPRDLSL